MRISRLAASAILSLSAAMTQAMSDPTAVDDVSGSDIDIVLDGVVNCTDFDAGQNPTAFQFPQQQGFDRFSSRITARSTPFHMGHDRITKAGDAVTVTGKFDYGAILHKDLEGEKVRAYLTGTGKDSWEYQGEFTTNSDGKIFVPVDGQQEGQYVLRMVVMGDLTYADAYITAIEPGKKAVVFDIDETLTLSDLEQVLDYTGIEAATPRSAAGQLVQEYIDRGYHPVFVTARSYWYAKGSRRWLRETLHLPDFTLRTTLSNEIGLFETAEYKTDVLQEFQAAGMEFFRAYGNADTDAEAFHNAGIPLAQTYIIGENAGINGTQALTSEGYEQHISDVVLNTPHSGCN
ncbi:lipin/Ned1/Smp2 family protein [Bacterioplanoides sp.]|uniref:lipin/Ned1/Smp2 family protein n=1 Tax=Bacterioplanoides sp. TaxID=2066072 RepID=UPI003B006509